MCQGVYVLNKQTLNKVKVATQLKNYERYKYKNVYEIVKLYYCKIIKI